MKINNVTFMILANVLWFGAWLYIIFGLHHSGWWILIPLFVHWEEKEEK